MPELRLLHFQDKFAYLFPNSEQCHSDRRSTKKFHRSMEDLPFVTNLNVSSKGNRSYCF